MIYEVSERSKPFNYVQMSPAIDSGSKHSVSGKKSIPVVVDSSSCQNASGGKI